MGDSDDEYDRRRARDKFRRERSDYQERRGDERGRREDYVDGRRDMWARDRGRRDYREVELRRRERYTPPRHDMSPPMKKMRREWDDRGYGGGYEGGSGYGASSMMGGGHPGWGNVGAEAGAVVHVPHAYGGGHRQPATMMTFKQFLASQDDSIGDEEAVKKYNDYKLEYSRQQLNEFYLSHKEEEWFKSKYQPEESAKRRTEQLTSLTRRKVVFLELMEKGWMENITLDAEKGDELIKLLDAVVIKLEGGSDEDLKVLDSNYTEEDRFEKSGPTSTAPSAKNEEKTKRDGEGGGEEEEGEEGERDEERKNETPVKEEQSDSEQPKKKSKRSKGSDPEKEDNGEEGEEEEEEADKEGDVDTEVKAESKSKKRKYSFENDSGSESAKGDDARRPESAASSNDAEPKTDAWDPEAKDKKESEKDEIEDVKSEEGSALDGAEGPKEVKEDKAANSAPKALHRTCSIFLRNLAPSITKQEVEAMCKRFPGFLRVAIADPQPERRFFRRGWATFERDVNIKDICWTLNNVRLRDCELGAIVNRDLTRRIRTGSGICWSKQVVRADIKLAAKLVQTLDKRHELWTAADEKRKAGENGQQQQPPAEGGGFALVSPNPLLKNITDYLIEEADAEEEELLGKSASEELKREEGSDLIGERDEALAKVLDHLILYLRIVHSIDYYNHSDYPNEDEMPNRCGIMHARGLPPQTKIPQTDVTDYITLFVTKMGPFLQAPSKLSEEEALKLGKKDPNAEVEKFVTANTQELGKDKWLCPLSGKKFKGPEFVRKHIFNKHGEKVDEVRKEVEFFNNYLTDPKRPHVPEFPLIRNQRGEGGAAGGAGGREGYAHPGAAYQQPPAYGGYGYGQNPRMNAPYAGYGNRGGYNNDNYRNSGGGGGYHNQKRGGGGGGGGGGARNRGDPREIVGYHDLDAPDDLDLF